MHKNVHTKIHKQLDTSLNELVADFIDYSGVPAHLATVHQLLAWSREQAKDAIHPNPNDRHGA